MVAETQSSETDEVSVTEWNHCFWDMRYKQNSNTQKYGSNFINLFHYP